MVSVVIIIFIVLFVLAAIAFGIYYYLDHHKKDNHPKHEDYLWLGQGEHPLKGMKRDK